MFQARARYGAPYASVTLLTCRISFFLPTKSPSGRVIWSEKKVPNRLGYFVLTIVIPMIKVFF